MLEELAARAAAVPVPGAAARLSLFDACGCVIAGAAVPCGWPLDAAGRIAFAAHVHDQDDLHAASLTHPGGIVWSAVLGSLSGAGTLRGAERTLGDALAAATCGYELTVRLAEALGPEHRARWHVTATTGTVGAAGAAARLLGGEAAVLDAIGHAASVAGGSIQAILERSGTRFLHRAQAASTGAMCARAACAGMTSSRGVLTPGRGTVGLPAAELPPAPGTAAIAETGFRLYPGNGFAHAAMDAALAAGRFEPARIVSVSVTVAPAVSAVIASNPEPVNDDEAWWSIEHAVATSLATGGTDAAGSLTTESDIRDLCRRVEVGAGGSGWEAAVEVVLTDGTTASGSSAGPPGQSPRTASGTELRAKWRRLTGDGGAVLERLLAAEDAEPFLPLVEELLSVSPAARSLLSSG